MEYRRYPNYKDSGVEWLGEIPNHWEVRRIAVHFKERNETNCSDLPVLSISIHNGISDRELEVDDLDRKITRIEDRNNYKVVRTGDIAFNMMRAWQGAFGVATLDGLVSPAYVVASPGPQIVPEYIEYLLRSPSAIEQMRRFSKGITDFRLRLYWDEFRNVNIVVPPQNDQFRIVQFLDRETNRIDALIEKKQRLIELLKEKRQAVITQAVTKGLDPNVPMKDSGVEWLGEVPKHWNVAKLKRVTGLVGGYAFSSDDFEPEGIQLLRIGNVYQNKLSLERQPVYMPVEFLDLYKRFAVYKGDLLVSMTGTIGKRDYGFAVKTSEDGPFLLNQRVGKFLINDEKITTDYLEAVLHSDHYLNQLYSLPFGTKQANLSNDDILSIEMGFPPTLTEQVKICDYILENTVRIDNIIAKSDESIDLLIEHRSALITAAVTGQIDVRNVA